MTLDTRQLCNATTREGTACRHPALAGRAECFRHRPESRALASIAGKESVVARAAKAKRARVQAERIEVKLLSAGLDLTTAAGCGALLEHAAACVLMGDVGAAALSKALVQIVAASEAIVRLRGFDDSLADLRDEVLRHERLAAGRVPLLAAARKEEA